MKRTILLILILTSCRNIEQDNPKNVVDKAGAQMATDIIQVDDNGAHKQKTTSDSISKPTQKKDLDNQALFESYQLNTLRYNIGSIIDIDTTTVHPYHLIVFSHQNPNLDKGILLVDVKSPEKKIIWHHYNELGAHSYSWIDFDNDGDNDVYELAGYDDRFSSRLYLNQINENGDIPFSLVYNNEIAYCALVDMNGDNIPEIFDQKEKKEQDPYDYDPEMDYEIPEASKQWLTLEYERIVGSYDRYNYNYGMPNAYKWLSLGINAKVQLLEIQDSTPVDVSHFYTEHFCARSEILGSFENVGSQIKPWIDQLSNDYASKCE